MTPTQYVNLRPTCTSTSKVWEGQSPSIRRRRIDTDATDERSCSAQPQQSDVWRPTGRTTWQRSPYWNMTVMQTDRYVLSTSSQVCVLVLLKSATVAVSCHQ